ncbi:hypothetical protein MPSEU_000037200 [Mayamaea pseudoterrestris]|nr:hypothetical protein MPSEU_000037200 [Mayamaea pseudoterrestris]
MSEDSHIIDSNADEVDLETEISSLLFELASSRPDSYAPWKRRRLVERATEILREEASARRILAAALRDVKCSSLHAHRRVIPLVTLSLLQSDDLDIQRSLVESLTHLLEQANDPALLASCRKELSTAKQGNQLAMLLQPLSSRSIAAIGLGSGLEQQQSFDWLGALLQYSLTTFSTNLSLVQCFLTELSVEDWRSSIRPALLLKLKSHPDKALSTILGWIQHLNVAEVDSEWTELLIKHLIGSKEENRATASEIIVAWSKHGVDARSQWTKSLATTKVTLVPARMTVYATLQQMAALDGQSAHENEGIDENVASVALEGIVAMLAKETKSEHCVAGQEALIAWLVVACRRRANSGSKGYDKALDYMRSTVAGKSEQFGPLFTLLVQLVHPDTLNLIVVSLFSDATFRQGLEGIIGQATSKKAVQVEGLVAVYLSLVFALQTKENISDAILEIVSAGSSVKGGGKSFLYSDSMIELVATNPVVSLLMARTLCLYTQLSSTVSSPPLFKADETAASRAMAACVTHPASILDDKDHYASSALVKGVTSILRYLPDAAEGLVKSIFQQVDASARSYEELVMGLNATKEAREWEKEVLVKGQGSIHASHSNFDSNAVRLVAGLLSMQHLKPSSLARVMILMHAGSSLKNEGQQRAKLILHTLRVIRDDVLPRDSNSAILSEVFDELLVLSTRQSISGDAVSVYVISAAVHKAALSLLLTLGGIASNYTRGIDDPEDDDMRPYAVLSKMFIDYLCPKINEAMWEVNELVASLSQVDMDIYLSPVGVLIVPEKATTDAKKKDRRLTADEEWEMNIKMELAKKKEMSSDSIHERTADEVRLQQEQDRRRVELAGLLDVRLPRLLESIRCLSVSDVAVGNECLPVLRDATLFLAVCTCPAMAALTILKTKVLSVLASLAACVYEIDEIHAPTLAQALIVSCKSNQSISAAKPLILTSALPSPCAAVACAIDEMDNVHECLSGPSFIFLFPIIQASLMGPRTPPGCEAALRLLARHTTLLAGSDKDVRILGMRREMAMSVLELLRYDRAQSFHEPTPFEALIQCFNTDDIAKDSPALSTSEISPLLDERGALGNRNCRIASMLVLEKVGSRHRSLLTNNPLVENRIWCNCFDLDEEISHAARRAWLIVHGISDEMHDDSTALPSPSLLYAPPLLPLLSNNDKSIAEAAALALANAMARHRGSIARTTEMLCKNYVDSVPFGKLPIQAPVAGNIRAGAAPASQKKNLLPGVGLSKKATTTKSALAVAGIGRPKTTKKKAVVTSALLKPKQERQLEPDAFVGKFISSTPTDNENDSPFKVAIRLGILRVMAAITETSEKVYLDASVLKSLTTFLIAFGLADSVEEVKGEARRALCALISSYGGDDDAVTFLLPQLESVLKTGTLTEQELGSLPIEKIPDDVESSDRRKEGAVIALGSVALHLKGPENESQIHKTVDMLIEALRTPSEDVQASVADGITKLAKKGDTQDRMDLILTRLLEDCLSGSSMAVQRGAAYGIAAMVKGSGIGTLKRFDVVKKLEDACAGGDSTNKEGALFAIELLSARLGLLFEPYVIALLPSLLKSFSDSSDHVRTAAAHTAEIIMSKLSAHGVKLIMPAVLSAFTDPSWRTKQASIQMAGAMSHLAPKQLASALPKVVPQLTEAFSDTHPKVKASAQEALNEIGTVIKNPEISSISSILMKALTDPADYTARALESLIGTEFLHAIDAPSLALIAPILHRGLRDRGATTKRFGGLITGNITTMIADPKDMLPYLPLLLPDLQSCLLDPIPDVRSTAAKALGSLTRSLGDEILPELRPWLLTKLRDRGCSSAERSGAAQGLTEVLIASGSSLVENVVHDEILPLQNHQEASTREGVLWVLTFLPPAMGQGFMSLLDQSLPALIGGLSDDSEPVRDVAMRAGRVLIRSHGRHHLDKILPSLENGLANEDYRIRVASLSLLGDLLSMIGNTTLVKGDGDTQDDIRRAERAQAAIALALGAETRRRVLSGLYLARNDTVHVVRQNALQVWKTVVSVTGRTLREILPDLVSRIINDLASGEEEKTMVAGRCLGDVVSKLGETVLPQIVPVLRNALNEGNEHTREGVCVGLTEVIKCSTKDQILRFIEILAKVVTNALCDDNENVRKMAAISFQSLHAVIGNRALDEVVPSLMVALENHDNTSARVRALNGITSILRVRSRELLPYIIPRLITKPISIEHANALAGIAAVTGNTLYSHFGSILPAVLRDLSEINSDEESFATLRECARSICASTNREGVNLLVNEIASKCGSDKNTLRRECCWMLETLITERAEKQDFYPNIPVIIRELVYRLNDDDHDVLLAAISAFAALTKHAPAEELVTHVSFMKNLIASMVSEARFRKGGVGGRGEFLLPGFNLPNGLEPLLPIFQRGILYGSPEIREVSAAGLGEVISLTSPKYLAGPLIVKMTGPLLRIVGDRNPANVKVAILNTLGLILVKGGPALRAFVPQFQTTFVKALSDPSRRVRLAAIDALSLLMPLTTRVDPLIKELVSGALGQTLTVDGLAAASVQHATLEALAVVLAKGGEKAKLPASIPSALDASKELIEHPDLGVREAAAKVMGEACAFLDVDASIELVQQVIMDKTDDGEDVIRHGKMCAILRILESKIGPQLEMIMPKMKQRVRELLNDQASMVREAATVSLGAVIGRYSNPRLGFSSHETELMKILTEKETMEMQRAVARALCVALSMVEGSKRVDAMDLALIDACLKLALGGAQRVQFAFNDVLWLALDVPSGDEGLNRYSSIAVFDNIRSMKSLYTKVLTKMTECSILKD